MAIVHRLLLFLIWATTAVVDFLIYVERANEKKFLGESNALYDVIVSHWGIFLIPIAIGLVLSWSVNWIITGDMHSWVRN